MSDLNIRTSSSRPIELRLWQQFVAVAEELHFGHAAARLHMTQPPLTQAIAQLEKLLEVRLFDRTKRSVQLTATGLALLPAVQDLLQRALALTAQARSAAAGEEGRLRLAFVSTVGFDLLPKWVRAFRDAYPRVQLDLLEATGDVQLQALERNEIDAGLMLHAPGFAPVDQASLLVEQESLVLAMSDLNPLARCEKLDLRNVLAEPLVIFPRRIAPSLHDAIFALYHSNGGLPAVKQEAIQMQTIVNLVSAGMGVAWVPASVRQFQRPGVVYRQVTAPPTANPLTDASIPGCETSLVWAKARASPALIRFIAFAKSQVL
jgi:DNA-binding transcriptional LysR family regulator